MTIRIRNLHEEIMDSVDAKVAAAIAAIPGAESQFPVVDRSQQSATLQELYDDGATILSAIMETKSYKLTFPTFAEEVHSRHIITVPLFESSSLTIRVMNADLYDSTGSVGTLITVDAENAWIVVDFFNLLGGPRPRAHAIAKYGVSFSIP